MSPHLGEGVLNELDRTDAGNGEIRILKDQPLGNAEYPGREPISTYIASPHLGRKGLITPISTFMQRVGAPIRATHSIFQELQGNGQSGHGQNLTSFHGAFFSAILLSPPTHKT
jgi:hypothetical protein